MKIYNVTTFMYNSFLLNNLHSTRWITDLINNILKEGCIPDDWINNILVPVYKGKCDPRYSLTKVRTK